MKIFPLKSWKREEEKSLSWWEKLAVIVTRSAIESSGFGTQQKRNIMGMWPTWRFFRLLSMHFIAYAGKSNRFLKEANVCSISTIGVKNLRREELLSISFQRLSHLVVLLAQDFIRFLTTESYRKRPTSLHWWVKPILMPTERLLLFLAALL